MSQLKSRGFTLVELMLAVSFIGVLLITVAATTMQIINIYTKGLTVREVNQAGQTITEDVERTIASSPSFIVVPAKTSPSDTSDSKYVTQPGGGRLCTGQYTYAWNYGKARELSGVTSAAPVYNRYTDSADIIRFAKVSDIGGALCRSIATQVKKASAKELLPGGDRNLAIQKFEVAQGARDDASSQALYAITVVLGTNDQTQLTASGSTCLGPKSGGGNDNFCAINQFDIVTRTGNQSRSER